MSGRLIVIDGTDGTGKAKPFGQTGAKRTKSDTLNDAGDENLSMGKH